MVDDMMVSRLASETVPSMVQMKTTPKPETESVNALQVAVSPTKEIRQPAWPHQVKKVQSSYDVKLDPDTMRLYTELLDITTGKVVMTIPAVEKDEDEYRSVITDITT